jgi:hypothetical protein
MGRDTIERACLLLYLRTLAAILLIRLEFPWPVDICISRITEMKEICNALKLSTIVIQSILNAILKELKSV